MNTVINRGSRFFLRASTLLDSESKPTVDGFMDWGSDFFQSLEQSMDSVINWLGSLISGLGTEFTKHKDLLLHVAGGVGVALAVIVVAWLLCNVISCVVSLLWSVIYGVVSLIWKAIMAIFRCCTKVIMAIFRCCNGDCCCNGAVKTMKAPGRNWNFRIARSTFESNPASYFSKLHFDQRNGLV